MHPGVGPKDVHDSALTPREREVLRFLASGLRTAQIAHELQLAKVTVELHTRNARRKLGALTREHAVALALGWGIIPLPAPPALGGLALVSTRPEHISPPPGGSTGGSGSRS